MIRWTERRTDRTAITKFGRRVAAAEVRAAHIAVDRATRDAHRNMQAKMKSVGLGRLDRAVGVKTSEKKARGKRFAWGAVFAKGGDDSRAGGALEAYSRGTTIKPVNQDWLWFQTDAIQRKVSVGGRLKRITPALYNRSGLATTVGKLNFRRISANRALLVVRNVSVSPKTGRAKHLAKGKKTRTRIPMKEIVVFVGIKWTRRAKRFDKDEIMSAANDLVATYMQQEMETILASGPQ